MQQGQLRVSFLLRSYGARKSHKRAGVQTGSLTGQLLAGTYTFSMLGDIRNGLGGNGQGTFNFTMKANDVVTPPDNGGSSVPDAGSTMMMLGMALTAIGGIRSKLS